jgi:ATP phosphoribosyltransferase
VTARSEMRIGVPSKGRLAELSEELLLQSGLNYRRQNRTLFARVKEMPIEITFLRPDDIPVLCAEGAIDMGITGSDLVEESGADVITRLHLGVGNCRLALCVPIESKATSARDLNGCKIATSFPRITRDYLSSFDSHAHMVELSGSVEVMVTLGVADCIVDLVETGSTLAANRLRVLDEIGKYETVLIQNKSHAFHDLAERVARRIEGVVIAQAYSLLEYNVQRAILAEAEAITPGFKSPTINPLEDKDWCAIKVMIRRSEVISVMERLEKLGATAILETRIANCRL